MDFLLVVKEVSNRKIIYVFDSRMLLRQQQMMSQWGWIAWSKVKNTRMCRTSICRSLISKLHYLWLGMHIWLLYLGIASKAKFEEKLYMHMTEIWISHSKWVVALLLAWCTFVTSLACKWHAGSWINFSYTQKTQPHRLQTWSCDCTSSVCLGGVSRDE